MDWLEQTGIFLRVAELGSFTQAADSLGLPRGRASHAVQQLEARLGTRLLHRTTRRVQLTQDGQTFLARAHDVLADVGELESMFHAPGEAGLRGRVRLDMSTGIARYIVMPAVPALLAAHPLLELEISSTERRVDVVREGFDLVLRTGAVLDESLIALPLGELALLNCASPAYLRRHGKPRALKDLADPRKGHRLVHFAATLGARPAGFEYVQDGQDRTLALPGAVTVSSAEAYAAACEQGLGLIQVPRVGVQQALADGRLVEVLPALRARAMPLTLLYANRRQQPRRVRLVMDWLAKTVRAALA